MRRFILLTAILSLAFADVGLQAQDTNNITKLEAFARTFGYVRFFHPSDQAALVDWDGMAYFGTKQVLDSPPEETTQQLIEKLFGPIIVDLEIYEGAEEPRPTTNEVGPAEILAWQHKGIGLSPQGLYHSVRLNRSKEVEQQAAGPFGNLITQVDATPLRGKEVRYRFDAKIEKGRCRLQGWWRADLESKGRGLFENMADRPIQSPDWKEYELSGTVDQNAVALTVGVMFFGNGSALVDNVRLEQKEDDGWKEIKIVNPDFESGKSQPEGWVQPARGYDLQIETKDVANGKQSVRIARGTSTRVGRVLFDQIPKLGEVVDVEISPGLRLRMPLALPVKTEYKTGDDPTTDSWINKVNGADTDNADQEIASVANVILLWTVFEHFYPYFEQVETDWDAALSTALQNGLSADDREKATRNLQWLVAQLHDGHGNAIDIKSRKQVALVRFDWVEDQLVVFASDDSGFQVGDIVTQIDDKKSVDHLKEMEQYISGSSQWKRYRSTALMSQGTDARNLKIQRGEKLLDVELNFSGRKMATLDKGEVCRIEVDRENDSDDIWYIDMGRAEPKDVRSELEKLAEAKGVVLDFRGYPRGTQFLFQHMTDEHMQSQKWQVPEQIHPDRVDMKEIRTMSRWQMPPREPRFKGKMVFITNGSAISYAESCMSIVANYKLGEIIGSPTAGANGNINPFSLPGGYRVIWTGMRVMNHDDSQHHVRGVQPTIPMKPTIEGIKTGKDELLEHAVKLIDEQ